MAFPAIILSAFGYAVLGFVLSTLVMTKGLKAGTTKDRRALAALQQAKTSCQVPGRYTGTVETEYHGGVWWAWFAAFIGWPVVVALVIVGSICYGFGLIFAGIWLATGPALKLIPKSIAALSRAFGEEKGQ